MGGIVTDFRERPRPAHRAVSVTAMVTQRGLVVFSAMCSAGMLWSAVLIGGLLIGWRPVGSGVAVGIAALLTVPGAIAGVIANRLYYRTVGPRRPWNLVSWVPPHVPHWAAMLAGVIFFGFWLAVVVAFAGLDGNAELRDGRYVINDHGRVTTVNQADYERQLDHEQQISLGVLGAIGVGGAFMTAAVLTHEPSEETQAAPSAAI
jgi:hypothetical protein